MVYIKLLWCILVLFYFNPHAILASEVILVKVFTSTDELLEKFRADTNCIFSTVS